MTILQALEAYEGLITDAQYILEQYLTPDSGKGMDEAVNDLLGLLDGPKQREVFKLKHNTLANLRWCDLHDITALHREQPRQNALTMQEKYESGYVDGWNDCIEQSTAKAYDIKTMKGKNNE